jgi:hypothetical protein
MSDVGPLPRDLQIEHTARRTRSVLVANTAFALEGDEIQHRARVSSTAAELEDNTLSCGCASDESLDSFRAEGAVSLVLIADFGERGSNPGLGSHNSKFRLEAQLRSRRSSPAPASTNRIVMGPMKRCRSPSASGNVHTSLAVEYYTRRVETGLIITEGTQVSNL